MKKTEYEKLMEQAPRIKASGLEGDYRALAEFNNIVLAGHQTKYGMEFVTWEWVQNHTALWQGHYIGTMASAGGGTLAASIGAAKIGAATGTTIHPGIGTAIGVGGGLIGGAIGGTAVKALGDKIREDDSIILSRMFNGVLLNLIYEYMLQETEIDVLIEKLNSIKTKEFKKLFKDLISAKSQDKTIDNFVRHYFEEIIRSRPVIAEPSADDLVELLKQFDTDIDITANTP